VRPRFYRHRQWWWASRAQLFNLTFVGCAQYTRHFTWRYA